MKVCNSKTSRSKSLRYALYGPVTLLRRELQRPAATWLVVVLARFGRGSTCKRDTASNSSRDHVLGIDIEKDANCCISDLKLTSALRSEQHLAL